MGSFVKTIVKIKFFVMSLNEMWGIVYCPAGDISVYKTVNLK